MGTQKYLIILFQLSAYFSTIKGTTLVGGYCGQAVGEYIKLILQLYPGIKLPPFNFPEPENVCPWCNVPQLTLSQNLKFPQDGTVLQALPVFPNGANVQNPLLLSIMTSPLGGQLGPSGSMSQVMNKESMASHQSKSKQLESFGSFGNSNNNLQLQKISVDQSHKKHNSLAATSTGNIQSNPFGVNNLNGLNSQNQQLQYSSVHNIEAKKEAMKSTSASGVQNPSSIGGISQGIMNPFSPNLGNVASTMQESMVSKKEASMSAGTNSLNQNGLNQMFMKNQLFNPQNSNHQSAVVGNPMYQSEALGGLLGVNQNYYPGNNALTGMYPSGSSVTNHHESKESLHVKKEAASQVQMNNMNQNGDTQFSQPFSPSSGNMIVTNGYQGNNAQIEMLPDICPNNFALCITPSQ